eukprot:COSAG06_NODE_2032_length_7794_cov_35.231839_4_plen_241_part_00
MPCRNPLFILKTPHTTQTASPTLPRAVLCAHCRAQPATQESEASSQCPESSDPGPRTTQWPNWRFGRFRRGAETGSPPRQNLPPAQLAGSHGGHVTAGPRQLGTKAVGQAGSPRRAALVEPHAASSQASTGLHLAALAAPRPPCSSLRPSTLSTRTMTGASLETSARQLVLCSLGLLLPLCDTLAPRGEGVTKWQVVQCCTLYTLCLLCMLYNLPRRDFTSQLCAADVTTLCFGTHRSVR